MEGEFKTLQVLKRPICLSQVNVCGNVVSGTWVCIQNDSWNLSIEIKHMMFTLEYVVDPKVYDFIMISICSENGGVLCHSCKVTPALEKL